VDRAESRAGSLLEERGKQLIDADKKKRSADKHFDKRNGQRAEE